MGLSSIYITGELIGKVYSILDSVSENIIVGSITESDKERGFINVYTCYSRESAIVLVRVQYLNIDKKNKVVIVLEPLLSSWLDTKKTNTFLKSIREAFVVAAQKNVTW